ncbi:MAG: NAD-dependent epimerase/dehydratase family protein [Chloroflexi bacterium]|nr:NAD-dependent epimerase/dehydratase family protein [Chloroflexota bacterium]
MKAFVTGGTGFIGQQVIKKLLARNYEVYALARSAASAQIVADLGGVVVHGDITDVESMRAGMAGSDVVFHIAAWYKVGVSDGLEAEAINVGGTRKVLRLAHELGIPKIIYTSTIAVFGDTHGQLVDESFYQGGPFLSEYDRTKWLAHYKVALPLIEKGAPIIIVMPGMVYGPGDTSVLAEMMQLFYRGLPALPGPETMFTFAHVEDIAEGHLLALEKGQIGESYILAGPAIPLGEMMDFWGHLTGKSAPLLRIPAQMVRPFAPIMGAANALLPLPSSFSQEATRSLGATYIARSDKARAQLGWQTRPLQTGMLETFQWIEAQETAAGSAPSRERQLAGLAVLAAAGLFLLWLLGRRRK